MTSYCDVTSSVYPVTMTIICNCLILAFGMGHTIKQSPGDHETLRNSTKSNLTDLNRANCSSETEPKVAKMFKTKMSPPIRMLHKS